MHRSDVSFNSLRDPNVIVSPKLPGSSCHLTWPSQLSDTPAAGERDLPC